MDSTFGEGKQVVSLPNTYSALCILKETGDIDLKDVKKDELIEQITQHSDPYLFATNYPPGEKDGEEDVRMTYCLCAIIRLLGNHQRYWQKVNRDKITKHLLSLLTFQGGFTWGNDFESHAGLTYCATASLRLIAES